jgi:hypothetical protein
MQIDPSEQPAIRSPSGLTICVLVRPLAQLELLQDASQGTMLFGRIRKVPYRACLLHFCPRGGESDTRKLLTVRSVLPSYRGFQVVSFRVRT